VVLEWRATRVGQAAMGGAFLSFSTTALIGSIMAGTFAHGPAPSGLPIKWPPSTSDIALASIVVLGPVFFAMYLVLRGRRAALVATDEGVTRVPIIGRMKTVWWEDTRLLEVTGSGRDVSRSRRYKLYGRRSTVWWDERLAPGSTLTWVGMDASEGEARSQELVGLINVRTGLAPRTFVRWLQQQPEPKKQGQVALGDALMYAVLAVGAFGIAAVVLLVPFSASPVLNAIVAAPFGVFGFVFLMQALGRLGDFARRDASAQWELLHAPVNLPPTSTDDTFTIAFATPIWRRVLKASAGALLIVELVPIWLLDVVNPWDPSKTVFPEHPAPGPLGTMLACMLIPFGAVGGVLIVEALRSGQHAIARDHRWSFRAAAAHPESHDNHRLVRGRGDRRHHAQQQDYRVLRHAKAARDRAIGTVDLLACYFSGRHWSLRDLRRRACRSRISAQRRADSSSMKWRACLYIPLHSVASVASVSNRIPSPS
jgi:hypothetical protein